MNTVIEYERHKCVGFDGLRYPDAIIEYEKETDKVVPVVQGFNANNCN